MADVGRCRPLSWPALVQIVVVWALLLVVLVLVGQWADGPLPSLALAGLFLLAALGRRPLANAINGWWLRRGSVVRPGHYIRLEGRDDVEGYVARIGWRHTQLQTPAGDIARIPNTTLANSIFTNFHLPAGRDAFLVDFDAAETVEPARIVALLQQEARAASRSEPQLVAGSPQVRRLPGRFPGCRRYVMHCRVSNPERRDDVRSELAARIERRLRREEIPLPTLHRHRKGNP